MAEKDVPMFIVQDGHMEIPVQDVEGMALCAIRYTLGRMSYIVGDGVRWAREYGAKSAWVRGMLIRDLQEAVEREDNGFPALGMDMDSRQWRAVLAELLVLAK
jgi:hypothetical protein